MEVSESVGNKEARCKGGHFCVVPGCGNEFYKVKQQGRVVHFHSVPLKRQDVFHRWLAALKLDGHLVRRGSRVCSEHFVEDDYLTEKVFESGELVTRPTNKLKVDAAPSVFDFSSQKVVYTSRPVHTLSTGKDLKLAVIHQKRARRQALLAEQKEDQQGVDLAIPQKKPATSSEDMDSVAPAPVVCKVCGTFFETRRGLSSHARLHLRQLGVTLSESSGAPIELLYQLVRERGDSVLDVSDPSVTDLKITSQQESRTPSAPEDRSESLKVGSKVLTTPQKMDHQGSPVRLKESPAPLLPSPSSGLRLVESRTSEGSSSSSEHLVTAKPMWAPLETDAPISLASDATNEVHVCQLCGCWYGTRKGLSGHARAHLRQIGIPDKDIKGSPTDFLYQLMKEEDLKPFKESTSNSTVRPSKRPSNQPSPPASPPSKRLKSSENFSCILCGEQFENRKGLGIHARAHLRQIGVGDLLGKTSAIDTIQELVSSGMLEPTNTPITNRTSSPSTAPSPEPIPSTSLSSSPPKLIQSPLNRAPKAKKGFRLAVDPLHRKPKPEPVEIELSVQPEVSNNDGNSPTIKSTIAPKPLTAVSSTDLQSPPTVLCDYCGQLFETRKALSCHARAHLRQLGLSWSIRTSPIDLLKEVMMRGEEGKKLPVPGSSGKATFTPQSSRRSLDSLQSGDTSTNTPLSPLDYSMKEKSSSSRSGASYQEPSCELCGFEFENRKALASHARAHLRQLGIMEWKVDGVNSPIELLSDLIRKDPVRVAAITRRYRMGDLYIKKAHRAAASPSLSTDSDSVGGLKPSLGRENVGVTAGSSRHSHGQTRTPAAHSDAGVRSPRGVHPPKRALLAGEENRDSNSQQPSRSGSIPAMLPKPPLTPLVKLVGKVYSLKCRFCEEVFHGPLSVQERWITHLQKHILSLGYKGKESPPAAPVAAPALVHPVAV